MNVNIVNPWTFDEAKPNQITSMFHMLPLTWIYHMKMQKQVKNGYQGKMKIKKITPSFVPKGKQKNHDQAIEEN